MSDYIVKMIPTAPFVKLPESRLEKARDFLIGHVACDCVDTVSSEHPMFADCGENLEEICCPKCGEIIDFSWWGRAVNEAYENSFDTMDVILPCCGVTCSLNDLVYYFRCGFACSVIEIIDPEIGIDASVTDAVEKILGVKNVLIHAHI